MRLWKTPDCSCEKDTPYADGTLPEYYNNELAAARAFVKWYAAEQTAGHYTGAFIYMASTS